MTPPDAEQIAADLRALLPLVRALCADEDADEDRLHKSYKALYRVASGLPVAGSLGSELDAVMNPTEDDRIEPPPGGTEVAMKRLAARTATLVRKYYKLIAPDRSGPPPGPLTWERADELAARVRALLPQLLCLGNAWDDADDDRYGRIARDLLTVGYRLGAYYPALADDISDCDPFEDGGPPLPKGGAAEVYRRAEEVLRPIVTELRAAFGS